MSELNPLKLIGIDKSEVVDKAKALLPFDPSDIGNSAQEVLNNAQSRIANQLSQVDRATQIQQKILPHKKEVTFWLENDNGIEVPGFRFTMKINPSSITFEQPPKTVVPVRTMGGWILQHWFPELGTLGFSGQVGNMLERWNTDTRQSNRWREFQRIINVYQNNGVAYAPGENRNSTPFNPVAVCTYEAKMYKGYFETFSFTEDQDNPYTRNYDFSLKYSQMIDTSDIKALTKVNRFANVAGNVAGKVQGVLGSTAGLASKLNI